MTHAAVRPLLRAIDLPAREALEASRRPLRSVLSHASIGAVLLAGASLAAAALDRGEHKADVLRAVVEALVVVVPGTIGLATYFRLRVPPSALLAATAIGLLVGGVVAFALLPLMAFLALVARAKSSPLVSPGFLVPAVALCAIAATPVRVIRALDPSDRATWLARGFAATLIAAFAVRAAPHLAQLVK